jgi:hypothetical protein
MNKFKIFLNRDISKLFDIEYELMKNASKFYLTSSFSNNGININNNYYCECGRVIFIL